MVNQRTKLQPTRIYAKLKLPPPMTANIQTGNFGFHILYSALTPIAVQTVTTSLIN